MPAHPKRWEPIIDGGTARIPLTRGLFATVDVVDLPLVLRIGHDGVVYYLGTFRTEAEAAVAYNADAVARFGEFAQINDIGGTG